jgi:hypothetical protein
MSERINLPAVEEPLLNAERKEVNKLSRRSRAPAVVIALALVGPANPVYWNDVFANYQELQNAELSITVEAPPLDPKNSDSALVFLHGFNTYDAIQLTQTIGPAYQEVIDGEMWSVRYGNADFAEENIAREIEELAHERGVKSVTIFGYSAGGTIGSGVERNVFVNTDLDVKASIPTHSPANEASLQPYQKSELEAGKLITNLIPSSRYSTAWRWVFEMYFMRDRFTSPDKTFFENVDSFFSAGKHAEWTVNRDDLTSVDTLYQQIEAIDSADVIGDAMDIAKHAEETGKTLPIHGYVEITKPGFDYVVDNQKAASVYSEAAEKAGIQFFTIDVPTGVHSRPDLNPEDYLKALMKSKPAILNAIESEYQASHKKLAVANEAPSSKPYYQTAPDQASDAETPKP